MTVAKLRDALRSPGSVPAGKALCQRLLEACGHAEPRCLFVLCPAGCKKETRATCKIHAKRPNQYLLIGVHLRYPRCTLIRTGLLRGSTLRMHHTLHRCGMHSRMSRHGACCTRATEHA